MKAFRNNVFRFLSFVSFLCLISFNNAIANDSNESASINKFKLGLQSIEANKMSESGGDEVYVSVAEFNNYGKPSYFRVPSYPTYWLSKHFKSVKNVRLWEREFSDGEAAQLIISVIERDVPPWNVDDLIGAVKVNVSQKDGIINIEWDHKYLEHEAKIEVGTKDKDKVNFTLKGNNSEYHVTFDTSIEKVSE